MFYDLNLDENYTEFKELDNIGCSGFCYSQTTKSKWPTPDCRSPVYRRINIPYTNKLDNHAIAKLRSEYAIICITMESLSLLQTVVKLRPDLIWIPPEEVRFAKKTLSGFLVENGVYIEMRIKDGLYTQRVVWMNALRKLMRLGCKRCLIIASGASRFTELKGKEEVRRILAVFGARGKEAILIMNNTERLLREAALRRYSVDGAIANSNEEGAFKRDFIINYHLNGDSNI